MPLKGSFDNSFSPLDIFYELPARRTEAFIPVAFVPGAPRRPARRDFNHGWHSLTVQAPRTPLPQELSPFACDLQVAQAGATPGEGPVPLGTPTGL